MKKSRVLISLAKKSEAEIQIAVAAVVTGCKDNVNFEFTNGELTTLTADGIDYGQRLSDCKSGNHSDITIKNKSKAKVIESYRVICTEINRQHKGDTEILQTSGATLTADSLQKKSTDDKPVAKGLKGVAGAAATELDVKVDVIAGLTEYGTMFACIEALGAPDDANLWPKTFTPSHHTTIGGLKPATRYMLSAAYVGSDGKTLAFCSPILVATKLL